MERGALPDHHLERFGRQGPERRPFLRLEDLARAARRRAVDALVGHLRVPRPQRPAIGLDVDGGVRLPEAALHVPAGPLDLPLLLRTSRRGRVDLETIVAGELAVAPVQRQLVVDTEGGADHRALEVVGHEDGRDAPQGLERPHVEAEPGVDLLVEHQVHEHVPAVAQRHHEDPRAARHAPIRVVDPAGVHEVDLGHLPGGGLHGDRHVLGRGTRLAGQSQAEALHGREAPGVVRIAKAEPVVDGRRLGVLLLPLVLDRLAPALDARGLLRRRTRRMGGFQGSAQRRRLGQIAGIARQEPRPTEGLQHPPDRVPPHPQPPRDLAPAQPHPVQPHHLLQPVHVRPPRCHQAPPGSWMNPGGWLGGPGRTPLAEGAGVAQLGRTGLAFIGRSVTPHSFAGTTLLAGHGRKSPMHCRRACRRMQG